MLSQPRKDWSTLSSSARQLSSRGLDKMLDRMLTSTTERSHRTSALSTPGSVLSSTTTWAEVSHRAMTGKTGSFGYMAPEASWEDGARGSWGAGMFFFFFVFLLGGVREGDGQMRGGACARDVDG
jgi:hypothetical protein